MFIKYKAKVAGRMSGIEGKVRYDTIRQKSLTWTRKLSIQLNLAHVARTKTNKQCPFNSVQVKMSYLIKTLLSNLILESCRAVWRWAILEPKSRGWNEKKLSIIYVKVVV